MSDYCDPRDLDDAMPDAQRARRRSHHLDVHAVDRDLVAVGLLSAYAHKGNDCWIVDRSFSLRPPAQLPSRLSSLPYDLYLETDHWKELRAAAIAHYGDTCVLCDRKPVQVHHRTYARRGFEQLTDLIVLCDNCHSRYHNKTA